jgi:hypothetical protein
MNRVVLGEGVQNSFYHESATVGASRWLAPKKDFHCRGWLWYQPCVFSSQFSAKIIIGVRGPEWRVGIAYQLLVLVPKLNRGTQN